MISYRPRRLTTAGLLPLVSLLACTGNDPTGNPTSGSGSGSGGSTGPLTCDLDSRYLSLTAAAKDGIPAVNDPSWVVADHPTDLWFLRDSDGVVGFIVEGQAYAVPLNILLYHEITNATLGAIGAEVDLAITFCPLTGSSMVFDRSPAGGAEFGVSGILYQSNLVMYDRSSGESLWPQMFGQSRCGPLQGTALPLHPSIQMRWDGWLSLYPDTRVMGSPAGSQGPYDRNPYAGYDQPNSDFTFPMPPLDSRLPPKELVLGIGSEGGISWAFPLSSLEQLTQWLTISVSLGVGRPPGVVFWDRDRHAASAYSRLAGGEVMSFRGGGDGIFDVGTGSRWTVDGLAVEGPLAGTRLDRAEGAYTAYWGAWQAFFPTTRIWGERAPGEPAQ